MTWRMKSQNANAKQVSIPRRGAEAAEEGKEKYNQKIPRRGAEAAEEGKEKYNQKIPRRGAEDAEKAILFFDVKQLKSSTR